MPSNPVITLTTDFGLNDPFVGVMKGAILSINPEANIIDLSHGIASHNIREAAFTVGMNYKFFPERTCHVVVVDPGVGSRRRPLLVVTERQYFIGPDNGIFSYIYKLEARTLQVIHITADHYFLKSKSSTFQGRDVFAPVAAWLSGGKNVQNFGEVITDYLSIDLQMPTVGKGVIKGEIIHVDKFGNATTNISQTEIDALDSQNPGTSLKVFLAGKEVPMKMYYGEALDKELHSVINSSEYVEFFVNRGSAAKLFNIAIGNTVEIQSIP
ncbi:MAG: SAM-dependent chlorinase/fluorinase [Nitrospirae bacterium]|nr:SAM-dependent chlorinase/fluorinase [Nitrospirota bacterium]